jgi:aspartyl protease family protein
MRLIPLGIALSLLAVRAGAADIGVIGLFPGKAVLVIEGASPKTYSVGNTIAEGTKLVSVDESSATIEANGKRQTIGIGGHINRTAPSATASATLQADSRGHFVARGQINGGAMSMLVDTGATMIALSSSDALRLGINYKLGEPGYVNTANGRAPVYRIKLNTVKVGDIELNQVDAICAARNVFPEPHRNAPRRTTDDPDEAVLKPPFRSSVKNYRPGMVRPPV